MDKLISDADLFRFNTFLKGPTGSTFYTIDETLPPIEDLFPEHVFYAILFQKTPSSTIGHWVVLIQHDEKIFEYFDCLGNEVPLVVLDRLNLYGRINNINPILHRNSRSLMAKDGVICGKWVMFRLMTLPNSLEKFNAFIKGLVGKRKGFTADMVVNFLINIPVGEK